MNNLKQLSVVGCIRNAVIFNNYKAIDYFLEKYELSPVEIREESIFNFEDNWPVRWASMCGYSDVVKSLLKSKHVNPAAKDNQSIKMASENGHYDVAKMLLDHTHTDPTTKSVVRTVNPGADDDWAMRIC